MQRLAQADGAGQRLGGAARVLTGFAEQAARLARGQEAGLLAPVDQVGVAGELVARVHHPHPVHGVDEVEARPAPDQLEDATLDPPHITSNIHLTG